MSNYYIFRPIGTYEVVFKVSENSILSFLIDPANTDYQEYLAWVEEGNVAEEWTGEP